MAQSKKQLENLKKGKEHEFNAETAARAGAKGGKKTAERKRRHKTLEETMLMVAKLPLDSIGMERAAETGVHLDDIDPYDLTALTAVVLGQVRAAASGNSQAAQVVADWMDLSRRHKKDQLEIERLKAEIDRLKSGKGDGSDDDQVLQFIEGMKKEEKE